MNTAFTLAVASVLIARLTAAVAPRDAEPKFVPVTR
jgi:hypothetical protein